MIRNTESFELVTVKERVTVFLSELLILTAEEKTFLQRFSNGSYEPELLFDDAGIANRLQKHPMAAWRTQQILEEPY